MTWHQGGDAALFLTGAGFLYLWMRDRYRWLRLRAVLRSDEIRVGRLEEQHDLAQDVVSAYQRADADGIGLACARLADTFRAERPAWRTTTAAAPSEPTPTQADVYPLDAAAMLSYAEPAASTVEHHSTTHHDTSTSDCHTSHDVGCHDFGGGSHDGGGGHF